jgi:maltose alpha-D-glucosyltransferase/alpha-amylase
VGQLSYMLTMQPYGVFWFLLSDIADMPTWHTAPPEPLPEYATLVVRGDGLVDTLTPNARAVIDREALPAYLPKRRWFAAKGEALQSARLAYAVPLPGATDVLFAEVEAGLPGRSESYVLPLAMAYEDEVSGALPGQLALTRVRKGPRMGYLTDAFAVDGLTTGMLAALRAGADIAVPGGTLRFVASPLLPAAEVTDGGEIRRLSAEQSNSSWIVADSVVLKLVRRVLAGIHPEAEMTRLLTERGFGNTAPLFGEVVRIDTDGTRHTVALAQGFVRNQGDGWAWTLDYLARSVEELALTGTAEGGTAEDAEADTFDAYDVFARAIGTRLGELHSTLAQPSDDPAFTPEPADQAELDAWAAGAIEQIDMALDLLAGVQSWPDEATAAQAKLLTGHREALHQAARTLAGKGQGALRTRVHGDFHLGQVLVVQGDAYLIDFEGEPARTMEQRRAKSCPMRDVAGLLRSFDYAAAAAAPGRVAASELTAGRRQEILAAFRDRASAVFLEAYRTALANAPVRWVPPAAEQALLDLFLLEKAAYEIRYEVANRPAWLPIPLGGFHAIAHRLLGETA